MNLVQILSWTPTEYDSELFIELDKIRKDCQLNSIDLSPNKIPNYNSNLNYFCIAININNKDRHNLINNFLELSKKCIRKDITKSVYISDINIFIDFM